MKKEKPYNNGKWTEAAFRSWIERALRRARWPVKYDAMKAAYRHDGVNPETGRKCRLHECAICGKLFPMSKMHVDHLSPVVPIKNGWKGGENFLGHNWNEYVKNLYCEIENLQVLCKECHKKKSKEENESRRQ